MKASVLKIKIGIFALAMLSMSALIMSPVIGLVVQAFPRSSLNSVQMILSIAQLTGIVAAFLVARLAFNLSSKTIALLGAFGICVFGTLPYFYHSNLWFLILMSALVGMSVGFISNVLPSLISNSFDADVRQGVLGQQVAFVSVGTMLLLSLSGTLGTTEWYNAYLTHLFAGFMGAIAAICLPKEEKKEVESTDINHPKTSFKDVFKKNILAIAILGFCFMVVNNAYSNNVSLYVTESGLGSSDVAGFVSTIGQLGGLVAGLVMGYLVKFFKSQSLSAAFFIEGLGLLLIAFAPHVSFLYIGSFLAGSGLSMFFAQAPFLITIMVTPILIPSGMGILSTLNSLGGFLSPSLINTLNQTTINSSAEGTMLVGGIFSVIVGLIVTFTNFQKKVMQTQE